MDVICIVGPTAVGKTKLSIELAQALNGEIISGDSMQIYQGMDIGTAKVTKQEQCGIPHHLIDEKKPTETYSVAEFQTAVRQKIKEIKERKKVPIIVGGTGLYIKSVLYDYEFSNDSRPKSVDESLYNHLSNEALHAELKKVDATSAADIHPNNRKRVMRALEIFETSGVKKSEMIEKQEHRMIYDALIIGLTDKRENLYERINHRVDYMFQEGLVEEVQRLYDQGIPQEAQAIRAIGYKEMYDYFSNAHNLKTCKELIKRNSRRYAKRQYTWFRNQMDVEWFEVDVTCFEQTVGHVMTYIKNKS